MILIFIFVGVLVLGGVLFYWSVVDYDSWKENLAVGLGSTSFLGLAISIILILFVPSRFQSDKIEYDVEVTYLASIVDNDQMSSDERIKALTVVQEINKDILATRTWRDNPWVNWFYAHEYGDFKLLEFGAVPKATLDVQVNRDK
jgi:hypothetical protein